MRSASLSTVTWQVRDPIDLPAGRVTAHGAAAAQVRSVARAASLGDLSAQEAAVQAAVVDALTTVLQAIQPDGSNLMTWRDEIASATLVAANGRLAGQGIVLLDVTIDSLLHLGPTD